MAETITRQLREPFVESAGLGITDRGLQLLKTPIPTATYTGRQFVQDQSALEQQATAAAAGLDSLVGPDAYKQFMSPYQQEVIDTSLAAMDREQQKGIASLRQRAAQAGAFGGGREAASLGEYQATADIARAVEEARLREAGFNQARQAAAADLQARQGLGQFQQALGAQQRQVDQARLAADQEAAREAAFADYTQLGLLGPQVASVISQQQHKFNQHLRQVLHNNY
jgi:hypothetical protein